MNQQDLGVRLETAIAAARSAGAITCDYFDGRSFDVEVKTDGTPVTVADREAEAHLRERISAAFPDDGIVGEEFAEKKGRSGFRWILDPIDGTKSFVHRVPLYGTLVGVEHEGQSVIGVIVLPALEEYIYAARGQGAWHVTRDRPAQPARVSTVDRLADGLFVYSSPSSFVTTGRREVYERLRSGCKLARSWGDCYGYVLVATGRAEVMVDPAISIWDVAAMPPILCEAGGTFTDWQGNETIRARNAVATNGRVFEEVMNEVRSER